MKKLLLITALFTQSILSFSNYLDTPEYSYLKPFLKEEQQVTFNKLLKEYDFTITTLTGKINNSKDSKEKLLLESNKNTVIKEKERLIEKLNINIIKYPNRYTDSAIQLKEDIKKLVSFQAEVKG